MGRLPIGLVAVLTCTPAAAATAEQAVARTADPVKRGLKDSDFPRTIKVADNVYTYEDFHAGPEKFTTTSMFVVTDEGVLVADGQGSAAETRGLVDAIGRITSKPITYVVIASDHGDHTAGNASFPADATYIIHPTSKAILERSPTSWKPPASAAVVATKRSLTLGGEPIDILFLGRAHTGGDLAVSLPRRRILFLSEAYLNRVFPAMRSAYPREWVKTLERAAALKPDLYVAGHGFTEEPRVSREEFEAYRKALAAVIAEATRLHNAGVRVDEAVKQADWGEYGSWTLAQSQGPIAVRRIYDELDGKLK
jgi:glyoxylase-like metal-dependent hydrolase (beta-lactamase superfamily II)